ncbi:MAG: CpsD/CapB family tyrosine-protein kinase [Clostridia bacterium]|nr:CpsD/CapB family tyrosine-protein kinase [Clostridia bacterium]
MKYATITNMLKMDYSGTEAMNSISTNLSFVGMNSKKFIITSCTENEGKSSLCMQIMVNLAKRGKRVVFVDADLRKSVLFKRFGIQTEGEVVGLAHFLAGYQTLDDVIYQTDIPGAYIIPTGKDIANPLPLLDSDYFKNMLDVLAKEFDIVLVDAPPIGLVIDAAVISKNCDGAVLVVEYGRRRKYEVMDSVKQIEQSGCKVIGCILNKVTIRTLSEKSYYKNHYYAYSHYGYGGYGYGHKKE